MNMKFHVIQFNSVSNEKHILPIKNTPDGNCSLLMTIKASLSKANRHNLASKISGDAVDFAISINCSVNEFDNAIVLSKLYWHAYD